MPHRAARRNEKSRRSAMKIHFDLTHRGSSAVHLSLRSGLARDLACFAVAIAVSAPHAVAQTPAAVPRELPPKTVPVPDTVSPQMQKQIAAPLTPTWNVIPTTAEGWKEQVNAGYQATMKALPALRETLGVKVEPMTIDGVKAYSVTPAVIPPENRNRLLVHGHGGCFVSFPGESRTVEAVSMSGFARCEGGYVGHPTAPRHPPSPRIHDGT